MKKLEIKIGGVYLAKVTDKLVQVRLDAANPHGGWDATNLNTNKKVRIKSAQRLRGQAQQPGEQERVDEAAQVVPAADAPATPATPGPKGPKRGKTTKAEKAAVRSAGEGKKMSGIDAAAQLLADAPEPMRVGPLTEAIIAQGMWSPNGKTPAATLYSAILREMQVKGRTSRFTKTARGLFAANRS